ncbi:MAG: TolC family protein [Flavobacteriales bacterium]|nr:TolC family protein [Flavobacteriales bacterium]MCB9191926.1 TolC family protein [Flavobacteriales bacterium]
MKRLIFTCLILAWSSALSVAQPTDSQILNYEDYMAIVRQHHPMAIQSKLIKQKGDATVQMARGGFDPKIGTDIAQKYFKGDQYYSLIDAGLKVPTWFGIEAYAGYEQNGGTFLNPENSTSGGGLAYAGISLPVGRGLFIDERRAELRRAQIYQKSTQVEQRLMMNELLYEAGKAYWKWFEKYQVLQVYREALGLAEFRFNAVKQQADLGDKPSIDTLEAGIQLQNRQLALQEAQLEFKNATAMLSIFLWQNGQIPMELEESTVPVNKEVVQLRTTDGIMLDRIDSLVAYHPYLQQYRFKIDQLKIDRRMKLENLKPQLDLKYNALNQVVGNNPFADMSINNFDWGLNFSMPIPLRKERGALKLAKLKIQNAELDVVDTKAQIGYKITAALNEWNTTREQTALYQRTVRDYLGLLEGERNKFDAGESSLFMVNSRELGYINAQIKFLELLTKNRKAALGTEFELGILYNE